MQKSATPPARPFLDTVTAAQYLKTTWGITRTASSLATARCASRGNGPRFRKIGRAALYDPSDLDAWADGLLRRTPAPDEAA
jgi:hypothetical protein